MTTHSLPRREAARYLRSFGLRTTAASLATMANRSGGPPYFKIGKLCMYRLIDLEKWMSQRCTGLLDSTSTRVGRDLSDLFAWECDLEEDALITGEENFDEITRLLNVEAAMLAYMDAAGLKYDEQFI